MDRAGRLGAGTRAGAAFARRLVVLALAMVSIGVLTPSSALVPYQGWTPSSFGMVPECGKYNASGYLDSGCLYTRRMKFHPSIPGLALVGTLRHGLWISGTGSTWTPLSPHCLVNANTARNITGSPLPCGIEDIAFDPFDARTFYVSGFELSSPYLRGYTFDAGGVYKTTDLGMTFTKISEQVGNLRGAALTVIRSSPSEKATIMVGSFQHADHDVGATRSLAISYDDGASWRSVKFPSVKGCRSFVVSASSLMVASVVANPGNPNLVYAGTNGGLFQSSNRGRTWTPILSRCYTAGKVNIGSVWGIAVTPNGKTLYAGMWDGTLRVASVSRPTSWRTVMTLDGTQISHIMLDSRDPTGASMYVATLNKQLNKTYVSAGVYRVDAASGRSTLLWDSWAAGINHELGSLPRGPYALVKAAPSFWLAQNPTDPDVIYMTQALAGLLWRSEGAPLPTPGSTPSPPAVPKLPLPSPAPSAPSAPLPPVPPAPTAIPTATPTI